MATPKVPEHDLTAQGEIYGRVSNTDEKIPDLAPGYRTPGATPASGEDAAKPWITEGQNEAVVNDKPAGPQRDKIAEDIDRTLGPLAAVRDKVEDALEPVLVTVGQKLSINSSADTKNSAAGTMSQYTQAAWEKVNDLTSTIGKTGGSVMDGFTTLHERLGEVTEKGYQNASATAETAKSRTPSVPDVGGKLMAAGGDDVFRIMADGASPYEDPLKANMRATAETLI